jgi:hypothetical protein
MHFSLPIDRLTIFIAIPEYWTYFYCAVEICKVLEKFLLDKLVEQPENLREPSNKLRSESHAFLQRWMQNFAGFKGWRFICTADETHMRSSITLVFSEEIFGLFYDGQEYFEGSLEFDLIMFRSFWY